MEESNGEATTKEFGIGVYFTKELMAQKEHFCFLQPSWQL